MKVPVLPWIFQVRSLNSFDLSIICSVLVATYIEKIPPANFTKFGEKPLIVTMHVLIQSFDNISMKVLMIQFASRYTYGIILH